MASQSVFFTSQKIDYLTSKTDDGDKTDKSNQRQILKSRTQIKSAFDINKDKRSNTDKTDILNKKTSLDEFDKNIHSIMHTNSNVVYDLLMDAWLQSMIETIEAFDEEWLPTTIDKSQRYLISTYNNTEYRLFISTYLAIVLGSNKLLSNNLTVKNTLIRLMKAYMISSRLPKDRISFMKSARAINLSPSGNYND